MNTVNIVVGAVFIATLAGIAAADEILKERPYRLLHPDEQTPSASSIASEPSSANGSAESKSSVASHASKSASMSNGSSRQYSLSSSQGVVKKGNALRKKESVNVEQLLRQLGLAKTETAEESLMRPVLPSSIQLHTAILLAENDRGSFFAWIETDDVKDIFSSLKETLQQKFSAALTELRDDMLYPDDGAPYNILTFFDPAISPDPVTFIRVRNRLYELRMPPEKRAAMQRLIEELTR